MRLYESDALYIDLLDDEIHVSVPYPTSANPFAHAVATVPSSGFIRAIARGSGSWSAAKQTIREQARRIRNLKRTITYAKERNEERNRQLDALGMVWCDGGCPGGMARYGALGFGPSEQRRVTAEHIGVLLRNAGRAVSWYVNREYRRANFSEAAVAKAHTDLVATLPAAYHFLLRHLLHRGGPLCEGLGEDTIA